MTDVRIYRGGPTTASSQPAAPVAVLWAWWSFAAAAFTFPVQHWVSRTAATAAGEAAVRRGLRRERVAVGDRERVRELGERGETAVLAVPDDQLGSQVVDARGQTGNHVAALGTGRDGSHE